MKLRFFLFFLILGNLNNKTIANCPLYKVIPNAYAISLLIKPLANQKIYLGSYYGKFQTLLDSAVLDAQGKGTFSSPTKHVPGVYFLASSKKNLLVEFLMDDIQQFSLQLDSLSAKPIVKGSIDNIQYADYNQFLSLKIPTLIKLQEQLKNVKNKTDSLALTEKLKLESLALDNYKENFAKENPSSFLTFLFKAAARPKLPPQLLKSNDKQQLLKYYQQHFWDGISFSDERLLRTPFFDAKLEEYFKFYVASNPIDIINEVAKILEQANSNNNQFKYLLSRFTDKYINPQIMGQDKVFIYLFNQYYVKNNYAWLTDTQKKYIFDRAYSLISNQIGNEAPPLELLGLKAERKSLHLQKAKYTLLVFWDPNCGHCQTEIPRIDSIYKKSWKAKGLKIFAVNIDEQAIAAHQSFINKHQLQEWIHAYQPEEDKLAQEKAKVPNYRQLYDVYQTPVLYLLDENKKILAKKINIEQLNLMIK